MKHKKTSLAIASAAILAVGMQFAGAVPSVRISDGVNSTIIIYDDMAAGSNFLGDVGASTNPDLFTGPGKVTFVGSLGVWTYQLIGGITKPSQGSPTSPYMDLNFQVQSTSPNVAPPNLTIEFSETGFGPMPSWSNFAVSIGGTSGGTITCTTLLDVDNVLFSGVAIAGPQSFGTGSYGCDVGAPGQMTSPFSLTKLVVVAHPKGTFTSSGDTEITVPDGGTTLALLGGSLLGLGAIRRKLVKA